MHQAAVLADVLNRPESASRVVGQPLEYLAGHRAVEMDARAFRADDNLSGAGRGEKPPDAVAGKVVVQWLLASAADWNDLLHPHPAEYVKDLVAYADGI